MKALQLFYESQTCADLHDKSTGLYLAAGEVYGKAGQGFLRMNVACPREAVKDGLERLIKGIQAFRA